MSYKLGKLPPRHDPRTLKLSAYLDRAVLPPPPERQAWSSKLSGQLGMMLNDTIGDCTCAAAGHLIQTWTANASKEVTPSDHDILTAYEAVGGYNPVDPSTDQGAVILDVLNYWRKIGVAGHKIGAFAQIDLNDPRLVETAIDLFGGVDIGFQVPSYALDQFDAGRSWTVDPAAPQTIVGGHSVAVTDYTPSGLTCITWGKKQVMSWAFWDAFCDEAWAILSQDFLSKGVAPNGFNLAQLIADLAAIQQ